MRRCVLILFACCLILATLVESKSDKNSEEDKHGKGSGHSGENKKGPKGDHNSKGSGEDTKGSDLIRFFLGKDSKEHKGHNDSGEKHSKEHKGKHHKGGKNSKESKGPKGSEITIGSGAVHGVSSEESEEYKKSENEEDTSGNIFRLDAKLSYYYPRNVEKEKVALLDYHNNVSVFYDGLTGDAFSFSYELGKGVYIPRNTSDKVWYAKDQSYEEYFKNPVPPTEMFRIGQEQGYQFEPDIMTREMSEKLSEILTPLSSDYSSKCEALATALHVGKITSDRLKTSLAGFEKVMGDVLTKNRGDFKWLIGIYQGMGVFFDYFGSIDALNKKNVKLNLTTILTEETGIHVLGYFLEVLGPHFDLGKILGESLTYQAEFFVLINKLGGEINYGFDGLINVITEIVQFNIHKNSEHNLNSVLNTYFTNPRANNTNWGQKWKTSIQDLQETIKKLKLEKSFPHLMKLLQDILDGKWRQGHVNMSEVINYIISVQLPANNGEARKVVEMLQTGKN